MKRMWVAVSAVSLLLVAGCSTPFGETPTATSSPTSSSPAKSPYKVALPDKLGSRARLADAKHATLAAATEATLRLDSRISFAASAFYASEPGSDKVHLAAATTKTPLSKAEFESTFTQLTGGGEVKAVVDVDPGPLGGMAKCGGTKSGEISVAVCGWADEGTFGIVMFYDRIIIAPGMLDKVKAELITIRGAVETKT